MSAPTQPTLDYQAVSGLLSNVRHRIRTYVWAEAVLLALVLVGAVFWGGLVLDWMFEPPPQVRMGVHVVLVVCVLSILVWWGLRRWMVALSDRSLALLVERKHPELQDALSVAVDLHNSEGHADVHPELAARTIRAAADAARNLDTEDLLNQLRINRFALLVGALAISVIALAVGMPRVWDTYTQRLALSPEDWPRTVGLTVEGFEPDGQGGWVRKVARNSDVPVVVLASLADGLEAPDRVTIRYRWDEGRRGRDDLIRIGDAVPGRDENQRYEYLFERIAGNVEFDIRGGDDRVRRLRLEVVERPKVTQLAFECDYPDYLDRADRTVAAGPRVELPEGTVITAVGKANKPLAEVRWRRVVQDDDEPQLSNEATDDFKSQLTLGRHDVDLEVELLDKDGIASAEPFRVTLASRLDEKPQVLASREGIGMAVTNRAQLPIQLDITDDYAVDSVWLDIQHGEAQLPRMEVKLPSGNRNNVISLATVDLAQLTETHPDDPQYAFTPGGKVTITPSAKDKFNLADESRATAARSLSFEIVTEEDLLSRLASSEQNLRQTFESVADKLLLLYDAVEKLDQQALEGSASVENDDDLLVVDTLAEPDAAAETAEETSEEPADTGRLAREAVRSAESARQIADEVLGVASGFEDIHAQLFNNRIDNSEMSDRIGNRIAAPLRKLGEERMASVADKIAAVATGASTTAAKQEMQQAIVEVETLLREMKGLENYNEIVAMLREIIRQQEQINTKTKDQQKSDLKDLLLD
ncbi:hypothetical protein [Aeoliella sp.]|uniref:hypothetical protein n=1 Tax=Aeoliella sp. TaxID=2795800 RepID=UPI003CCBB9E5